MPLPTPPARRPSLPGRAPKPRLERHPLSEVFGDMPVDQFEELKADIKKNGLLDAITLHEGKVLDGWHRYTAAMDLGLIISRDKKQDYNPEFDGETPEAFVYSKNLFRRQLPTAQRIEMAAKFLGYEPKGRGGVQKEGPGMAEVAKAAGVSTRTVMRTLSAPKVTHVTSPTLEKLQAEESKLVKRLEAVRAAILDLGPKSAPARRTRK